jgi:hypothetical protein
MLIGGTIEVEGEDKMDVTEGENMAVAGVGSEEQNMIAAEVEPLPSSIGKKNLQQELRSLRKFHAPLKGAAKRQSARCLPDFLASKACR